MHSVRGDLEQALEVGLTMMARLDPEWAALARKDRLSDAALNSIMRCETRQEKEQLFSGLLNDIVEEYVDYVNMISDIDAAPVRTPNMTEFRWLAEQHAFKEALKSAKMGIEAIKEALIVHTSLYGEGP